MRKINEKYFVNSKLIIIFAQYFKLCKQTQCNKFIYNLIK